MYILAPLLFPMFSQDTTVHEMPSRSQKSLSIEHEGIDNMPLLPSLDWQCRALLENLAHVGNADLFIWRKLYQIVSL